jgi:hypothetical protein
VAQNSIMERGALDFDTQIILWFALLVAHHEDLQTYYLKRMNARSTWTPPAQGLAIGYYNYKTRGSTPIYNTVYMFPGVGATDPRDRFFALSGVSAGLDLTFVNYDKNIRDMACLVVKMALLGSSQYYGWRSTLWLPWDENSYGIKTAG